MALRLPVIRALPSGPAAPGHAPSTCTRCCVNMLRHCLLDVLMSPHVQAVAETTPGAPLLSSLRDGADARLPLVHLTPPHAAPAVVYPADAVYLVSSASSGNTFMVYIFMFPVQDAVEASTEPLRPAACVMALLPPVIGPPYAPAALRHLMQPGSPIAGLYELCDQCEAMGGQAAKVNAAGIRKRLRLRSCQEALEQARELYDARAGQQLEAEIEQLQAEVSAVSSQAR